jgi:hypothetical protein
VAREAVPPADSLAASFVAVSRGLPAGRQGQSAQTERREATLGALAHQAALAAENPGAQKPAPSASRSLESALMARSGPAWLAAWEPSQAV